MSLFAWLFSSSAINVIVAWSGLAGVLFSVCSFIWKWIIKPRRDFKASIIANFKKLNERFDSLEAKLVTMRREIDEQNKDLKTDIDHQFENVQKDHEHLVDDVDKLSTRTDEKNDKLLEILLKYFSDRI